MLAALEATLIIAGEARREIPVWRLLAGMEMLGGFIGYVVLLPLLHAPQVFLKATGRTGPGRAIASVALVLDPARRGVRCAVGGVAPMPLRPLDAEAWVAQLIDWDNNRAIVPEALNAFREYVAAACIPDPVPAEDGSVQPLPPRCTAPAAHRRHAERALGRALS